MIKKNMIDLGLGGWMADFGEYLPIDGVFHDGTPAMLMHNLYPVLWAKLNREAVEESGKLGEIMFFMRAGAAGNGFIELSLWAHTTCTIFYTGTLF